MALAIDTSELTRHVNIVNSSSELTRHLMIVNSSWPTREKFEGPSHIYRACALATVIHDASSISLQDFDTPAARQTALDWQPDSDDEQDDMEVLHQLNQQAKSSPVLKAAFSQSNRSIASTTVTASCAFPPSSLPARAQGRPLSSFRRSFIRVSWFDTPGTRNRFPSQSSDAVHNAYLPFWLRYSYFYLTQRLSATPCLVDQSDKCVAWQLQFDVVNLSSRRNYPNYQLQRRRRSTIDSFHRVSAPRIQEDPPSNPLKETKQFRGVRYREDHKRWTAEMKPPNSKKKEYFGEFKSQTQAARVVDVAYHYYGKAPLNFSDTPHILEKRPIPENIADEDKLKFVKEQAKWVSFIHADLPFPPPSRVEVDGEGDDRISQPQRSLHLEATAGSVNDGVAEDSLGIAGVVGGVVVTNTLQEQQGLPEWSTSALSPWSPNSSLRIIDDGAEHSTALSSTNLRSPSEPSCDSHAQPDDGELVISGRGHAKRLRLTISAHQFSRPSHQVEVAESSMRAYSATIPVFPATPSPCPSDGDADQGDHGMCEPQPWRHRDPMAGSTEPHGVDGGAVIGTSQEQQALSVRNVKNVLCSSLRPPSSFIDIRDGEHPDASTSTNYRNPRAQFSSDSDGMPLECLMVAPPHTVPSPPTPFAYLSDHSKDLHLTGS